jgi:ligand-binding sensor domain-containing protein
MRVFSLTSVGGTVIAGTLGGGAFRSIDHGATWVAADSGLKSDIIYCFAVKGDTVYAGDHLCNVYQSVDHGKFWTVIDSGVTTSLIQSLFVDHGNLYAGTYGNGLCATGDNGKTWTKTDTPFTYRVITAMTAHGNALFVGISSDPARRGGVYQSMDNGAHWAKSDTGIDSSKDIQALAVDGDIIIAGTRNGIYRSIDNGATWNKADSGIDQKEVHSLLVSGGTIYAGMLGGVFTSADHGINWRKSNFGLTGTYVKSLIFTRNKVFAGTESGVFYRDAGGQAWEQTGRGSTNDLVCAIQPYFGSSLFAATWNGGVYFLENDTAQWKSAFVGNGNFRSLARRDSAVFAGSYNGGIIVSYDAGNTWNNISFSPLFSDAEVMAISVIGRTVFAGTNGNGIFRSDTAIGVKWSQLSNGIPTSETIDEFGYCNGIIFAGATNSIYRSADNGLSWTRANSGLKDSSIYCFAANGGLMYTATDSGIYVSDNLGGRWHNVSDGLGNNLVFSLTTDGETLFAGTYGDGVWSRPLSEMTVATKPPIRQGSDKSETFHVKYSGGLDAGYALSIALIRSCRVTIRVFDLSGRQRAISIDKFLGPGAYSYRLSSKEMTSGCYIIKMQAGNNIYTKKIPMER